MAISAYYQTLKGLDSLLERDQPFTDVFIASIHTDVNAGAPCLHLNDEDPDDPCFDKCWSTAAALSQKGVRISLMIGGAGGAFVKFFEEYDVYLALFVKLLKSKPFITGVDLDVEECLDDDPEKALAKICMLIRDLKRILGDKLRITLAPTQGGLVGTVGMGGFSYVDLWKQEGQNVAWLNGQFYGSYSVEAFDAVIEAGFPADKVLMGMMSCSLAEMQQRAVVIHSLKQKYPDFGGAFVWEFFDAPPTGPGWGAIVKAALSATAVVVDVDDDVEVLPLIYKEPVCPPSSSSSICAIL
jgi:hypothetical protein